MTFTTTKLVGNRVRVSGMDHFAVEGVTVLDSSQWDEINGNTEFNQATEAFDAAVESFFAPLLEAAGELAKAGNRPTDSLGYVVLQEGVEATPGRQEQLVKLTRDSMVLRLLESGDHSRLVWIDDSLEILEVAVTTSVTPAPVVDEDSNIETNPDAAAEAAQA